MKLAEMRDLTSEEIQTKIQEIQKDLFEARFKKATHQLEDTAIFRRLKLQVAQLQTVLTEKARVSQGETK